jgi:hypothetical protein
MSAQQNEAGYVLDPSEASLGIATYLSKDLQGFDAVSKARYSDFIVREVNLAGRIARLESLYPEMAHEKDARNKADANGDNKLDTQQEAVKDSSNGNDNDNGATDSERKRKRDKADAKSDLSTGSKPSLDWTTLTTQLVTMLGSETAHNVADFFQTNSQDKFICLPPCPDKEIRKACHAWIKDQLKGWASADTLEQDNQRVIRIWKIEYEREMPNFNKFERGARPGKKDKKRDSDRNDRNIERENNKNKFLQFVVYKENMDTGAKELWG